MKNCLNLQTLFLLAACLFFFAPNSQACDRSSLCLDDVVDLGGNQYSITMTFSCGAGRSGNQAGADQNTGAFGFLLTGATFSSNPATIVSPQTGATFSGSLDLGDTGLVYENEFEWWACIDGGCGDIQTVSYQITVITNGLPTNVECLGMEGGGNPEVGCMGPDMNVDPSTFGGGGTCTMTADAGNDTEVLYGYTPTECTDLTVTPAGGSGDYSYLWSTGGTTATINVCPMAPTTYEVTVTDNVDGCIAMDQVNVGVIDISCGPGGSKVQICYNGRDKCVKENKVQGYLNQGATLGSCSKAKTGTSAAMVVEETSLSMEAGPNPFTEYATIFVELPSAQDLSVQVYDLGGRMVRNLYSGKAFAGSHTFELRAEGLDKGMYIVRLAAANSKPMTKKLILQ